jgi:hypothetical protein
MEHRLAVAQILAFWCMTTGHPGDQVADHKAATRAQEDAWHLDIGPRLLHPAA